MRTTITMLDVDTIATFMMSIVTHYFASCGESLEKILDDKTDPQSTSIVSSSKNQTLDCNRHHTDQVAAYSEDGTTISHIGIYHERQPLKTQEINGTDLVFFPRPSYEMSLALIGKKHVPHILEVQRTSSNAKSRPDALENRRRLMRKTIDESSINPILSPSEVASKCIAMGVSKENINNAVVPFHQQQQQFPFDEERPPLASRRPSPASPASAPVRARTTKNSGVNINNLPSTKSKIHNNNSNSNSNTRFPSP